MEHPAAALVFVPPSGERDVQSFSRFRYCPRSGPNRLAVELCSERWRWFSRWRFCRYRKRCGLASGRICRRGNGWRQRVPIGPGSAGGTNNSVNDPSGAGNAAKAPQTPGTNAAGTANSTGSPGGTTPARAGSTSTRAAGGTAVTGPNTKAATKTEAAVDAENRKLDRMIKGLCRGC
jgi:hypothetical protein